MPATCRGVPLQHLIARDRITLVRWYIEYATDDQDCALPRFDVVFNAIGEADLLPDIRPSVARLLQNARVRNHPANIALTGRAALPPSKASSCRRSSVMMLSAARWRGRSPAPASRLRC